MAIYLIRLGLAAIVLPDISPCFICMWVRMTTVRFVRCNFGYVNIKRSKKVLTVGSDNKAIP